MEVEALRMVDRNKERGVEMVSMDNQEPFVVGRVDLPFEFPS